MRTCDTIHCSFWAYLSLLDLYSYRSTLARSVSLSKWSFFAVGYGTLFIIKFIHQFINFLPLIQCWIMADSRPKKVTHPSLSRWIFSALSVGVLWVYQSISIELDVPPKNNDGNLSSGICNRCPQLLWAPSGCLSFSHCFCMGYIAKSLFWQLPKLMIQRYSSF